MLNDNSNETELHRIMMDVSRVYVDARCRISYSAFFIQGLYQVFGKAKVSFSAKYFNDVGRSQPRSDYERYVCILLKRRRGRPVRIAIDFHDGRWLSDQAYDWCDVYAKVNLDPAMFPPLSHPKIVVTSPNSCYRLWSRVENDLHFWMNMLRCGLRPMPGKSRFRKDYQYMMRRLPLGMYESVPEQPAREEEGAFPYVFYVSTLWPQANCVLQTNPWRRLFMDVCRQSPCRFEGGFFATDPSHPQYEEFGHLRFDSKLPLRTYHEKMGRSVIAFNTPAVHNCHGWKLSEYLAMGKAILSTPISNMLPAPLEHGRNIHIVSNESEMREGVMLLLKDRSYRERLSEGARQYYRAYATPSASIRLILGSDVYRSLV
jgi:hypothetical protein